MAVPPSSKLLQKCVVSPTGKQSASVIFLHGSGDTGHGVRAWIKDVLVPDMVFPHIRVVYPTAPARPYTPMRGALSNVWFDRYKISQDCPENLESIDIMAASIGKVIEEEIRAGVPKNRIIIGIPPSNLYCRVRPLSAQMIICFMAHVSGGKNANLEEMRTAKSGLSWLPVSTAHYFPCGAAPEWLKQKEFPAEGAEVLTDSRSLIRTRLPH
ncbi:lysophospholipase-like protein 1 isoform X3 [Esox lucius]|uniref:lysophospholipase-like protein 1 isoform X3 n=1 Tax=Esox lucius TaxID=8010 RepID=UPI0010BD6C26|nr:lysophospholipase-like protein 1 isoform X3 [Esox lucius]